MFLLHRSRETNDVADSFLIENFKRFDDNSSLAELFQRYSKLIFCACLKYLKDEEDSKDAVMEIFTKIAEDLKNCEIVNFKAWLYAMTKNHCLMKIRQRAFENNLLYNRVKVEPSDHQSTEQELLNRIDEENLISELNSSLDRLNEMQRTCIRLFYLEEKSYREISEITNMGIKQVKSCIQNGKRNLKKMLLQREVFANVECINNDNDVFIPYDIHGRNFPRVHLPAVS